MPVECVPCGPIGTMKGVKWEDLTPAAQNWVLGWTRGICSTQVRANPSLSPAQREKRMQECVGTMTRDKNALAQLANRWQCRLREVVGVPCVAKGSDD